MFSFNKINPVIQSFISHLAQITAPTDGYTSVWVVETMKNTQAAALGTLTLVRQDLQLTSPCSDARQGIKADAPNYICQHLSQKPDSPMLTACLTLSLVRTPSKHSTKWSEGWASGPHEDYETTGGLAAVNVPMCEEQSQSGIVFDEFSQVLMWHVLFPANTWGIAEMIKTNGKDYSHHFLNIP